MFRRFKRISFNKVGVFQKVSIQRRSIENDCTQNPYEAYNYHAVFNCEVWVKRNSIFRDAILVLVFFNLNSIRIVRPNMVKRD